MGGKTNPFTDEEIRLINKEFDAKREFFRKNPEEAIKHSDKRMESENKSFLEFLKKEDIPRKHEPISFQPYYNGSTDVFYLTEKTLYRTTEQDYQPSFSIKIDNNIYLDFDENRNPTGLKIVKASKTLGVLKEALRNVKQFHMNIIIDFKYITVNAFFVFRVRNKNEEKMISPNISNSLKLPTINTKVGLTIA